MTAPMKKNRVRFGVETLESRQVLSAGSRLDLARPADVGSTAAPAVTASLTAGSDPDGNGVVLRRVVMIAGKTDPGARVQLLRSLTGRPVRRAVADAEGDYRFRLALPAGRAFLHVRSTNAAGASATAELAVARGDAIVAWNNTTLNAIREDRTNPPLAARNLAIVQLAVFTAVNSIDPEYESYRGVRLSGGRGASVTAAVSAAAHEALKALFPAQVASFDATLAECLATVPNRVARARGERLGREAAAAILALRAGDGSGAFVDAPPATQPGMWTRTPPGFGPPVGLNFAFVRPFVLETPSQFRPAPPPALDGAAYAAAFDEVKAVGGITSSVRTPDETAYAHFWADLPGRTFTPPGHWNQIAQDLAMSRRLDAIDSARLFAVLNLALADAGISCWDAKNFYNFWRPVTAIRDADTDGNAQTEADPAWTPLWASPAFSSYTSGHATFSGAAAAVLSAVFGADTPFSDSGDPSERVPTRRFAGFKQAAAEAAASRLYGGIHFRFDNEAGLAAGEAIGAYVMQNALLPNRPRR